MRKKNTPDSPVRPPPTKPRREKKFVVHSSSDDEGNTKCAPSPPKRRRTAVSQAIDREEAELAMAITQSLEDAHASTEVQSSIQMIRERDGMAEDDEDDDKVVVVEARMCLDENWVCLFTDYIWQQQAIKLFEPGCPPIRGKFGVKEPIKCTRA